VTLPPPERRRAGDAPERRRAGDAPEGEWRVHGERPVYDSDWVSLHLVEVEPPGTAPFEHHVVRLPHHAAGAVVADPARGVLLLWRHRFVTRSWGWEIPAGALDPGETPADAARRETIEESGWAPGSLTPLVAYHPLSGVVDQTFHVFLADGAERVGEPDPTEASRVEWLPVARVREELRSGRVVDGMTVTGLTYALAFGHLAP
jgi:8-oxo-dGTP pyrophosphatase MutT (NUDIX family)